MTKRVVSPEAAPGPSTALRSLRIIVADDDRDAVLTLMMVLRHEGHEVRGYYRAADVIRAMQEFEPDAVFLDLGMPDISGWEAAKEIRTQKVEKRPLLVAISGRYKQGSDRVLSELSGFDYHLLKPYEPSDVLRLLAPLRAAPG